MIQIFSLIEIKAKEGRFYLCDDTEDLFFRGKVFIGMGAALHHSIRKPNMAEVLDINFDIDPPFNIPVYDSSVSVTMTLLVPSMGESYLMFSEEPFAPMIPENGRGLMLRSQRLTLLDPEAFKKDMKLRKNRFS